MFLLYINDLPSRGHDTTRCRLFTDDCLLYRVAESIDDQVQLQVDLKLKALEAWASDWGMQFNPSKCPSFPMKLVSPLTGSLNTFGYRNRAFTEPRLQNVGLLSGVRPEHNASDCDMCPDADVILFCRRKCVDTCSATDDITMTVSWVAVATTVLLAWVSLWSLLCVTLVRATTSEYYTDQWAVEILNSNESFARQIAQRHGFTYVTTVSRLLQCAR